MCETALLTDRLEPTNEPYAIAKIAGIKLVKVSIVIMGRVMVLIIGVLCRRTCMVREITITQKIANVIPALIRRFHEAKNSGKPWQTFGAVGNLGASFFMLTTWRMPART